MPHINITDLDHMAFQVSNLDKTIEFYEETFGFTIKKDHRSDEHPWAIIGFNEKVYLCLYQQDNVNIDNNTFYHWGFHITHTNIDELSTQLQNLGIKVHYLEDGNNGVGESEKSQALYISDPDGYVIELSTTFGGGLK